MTMSPMEDAATAATLRERTDALKRALTTAGWPDVYCLSHWPIVSGAAGGFLVVRRGGDPPPFPLERAVADACAALTAARNREAAERVRAEAERVRAEADREAMVLARRLGASGRGQPHPGTLCTCSNAAARDCVKALCGKCCHAVAGICPRHNVL
jgi:hypothetical protein